MRKPTTPGDILRRDYLEPLELTQRELATAMGCEVKKVNRIVNGKARVTVRTAAKLADLLNTTIEFWLNAQMAVDLYKIRNRKKLPRLLVIGKHKQGMIV